MHIMAALAVCHYFSRQGRLCLPESILRRFSRATCSKLDEYLNLTSDCMDTWAVTLAIQEMRDGLSYEARTSLYINKEGALLAALSVWHEHAANSSKGFMMWPERKRYPAWCLARVFPGSHDFNDTYQMLLTSVGLDPHGMIDNMIKSVMARVVAGVKELTSVEIYGAGVNVDERVDCYVRFLIYLSLPIL